ncbi:hypothetical protein [Streptomyces sp. NPDC058664]|uniref:hypothetical protein n=1 Tax=unclassified Streptomyces TaxID=2593676 RepID=UPI00364622DA
MRWYLTGVVVSGFGTTAMWLVAGIWVESLTGSDSLAALAAFALWAPVLLGPLLGTLADRVRRRPLLVVLNAAMAVLLPLLLWVDSADRVWPLFAVAVGARALSYGTTALAASAVIGLGLPWVLVAVVTAVQREVPAEAVGRVAATANTLVLAPNAMALALGAGLVALVDVRVLLPLLAVAGTGWAAGLTVRGRRRVRGSSGRPRPGSVGAAG